MGATGTQIMAAIKKGSAWGTALGAGANDAILLTRESLPKRRALLVDPAAGQVHEREVDRGPIAVSGSIEMEARYDLANMLIALGMGTAGAPAQQGGTAAYKHTIQSADNADGKFTTLAIDKVTEIQEYPSVKVLGFTLRGQAGQVCTRAFELVADDLVAPATVNVSKAAWTYRDRANRILFSQGVLRINAQAGGALAGGDTVKPASWEITYRRPAEGEYLAGNANKIDEPVATGPVVVGLSLTFPIFSANTWTAALQADTRYKADLVLTGLQISGAYYYSESLFFPHLVLEETDAQLIGAGKIPNPVRFKAIEASAAPTGMSYTKPLTIELINKRTTDLLA